MVRAHWNGVVIAESDDTVVVDGNHYFPADAVDTHGVKIEDGGRGEQRRSLFDRFRRKPNDGIAPAGDEQVDRPGSDDDVAAAALQAWADAPAIQHVVAELDDDTIFAAIDDQVTVVDFWAPWCGPCEQLHPLFTDAAGRHARPTLGFARVNVDDAPGVATAFGIMSIPTIMALDRYGHEIDREIGVPSKRRLDQIVRHAAALADRHTTTTTTATAERGAR